MNAAEALTKIVKEITILSAERLEMPLVKTEGEKVETRAVMVTLPSLVWIAMSDDFVSELTAMGLLQDKEGLKELLRVAILVTVAGGTG
jgi:hypothetical protein